MSKLHKIPPYFWVCAQQKISNVYEILKFFIHLYLNILGAKGKYNKIISNVQHIKHIIKVLDYKHN